MASPTVDALLAQAPAFAQPIMTRLRVAFRQACPDMVESVKWGRAAFSHEGRIVALVGAFKNHVRFRFWLVDRLPDPHGLFTADDDDADGGVLILRSVADLPAPEVLHQYILAAVRLPQTGVAKEPRAAKPPKPALEVPPDFAEALRAHPAAEKTFKGLPPSHRREYLEWILAAKRAETRAKRLATAVAWLNEGKPMHWQYGRKAAQS